MASKVRSKNVGAPNTNVGTAADANIQITPYRNGYLIKGDYHSEQRRFERLRHVE
jgi:hypothetical protein